MVRRATDGHGRDDVVAAGAAARRTLHGLGRAVHRADRIDREPPDARSPPARRRRRRAGGSQGGAGAAIASAARGGAPPGVDPLAFLCNSDVRHVALRDIRQRRVVAPARTRDAQASDACRLHQPDGHADRAFSWPDRVRALWRSSGLAFMFLLMGIIYDAAWAARAPGVHLGRRRARALRARAIDGVGNGGVERDRRIPDALTIAVRPAGSRRMPSRGRRRDPPLQTSSTQGEYTEQFPPGIRPFC